MAYQALYRKWRPKVFEDVVGQQHIVETLKNQINSGKIAHAYLFCGSRGTGKTSTAKIFSRAVNCENPVDGNPCNECATCRGVLDGSIYDVVEIDGASNNKVDDVRKIRDEVVYPPVDVKYKVYIIDEVHMLSTEAFNALLKTLEEPPAYVIFILATTEFHKIPATIISRCQKYDFRRISFRDTARRIAEVAASDGIEITPGAVNLLSKVADGSLRDGLSKLDQCMALGITKIDYKDVAGLIGASDPEFLANLCDMIIDEKLADALKLVDEGINMGLDPVRLYSDIADYFRDVMMYKTVGDSSLLSNSEEEIVSRYAAQAKRITLARILRITETLYEGMANAKYSLSPKLSFEITLLKISSKATDKDTTVILERLEKLEEKVRNLSAGGVSLSVSAETGKEEAPPVEETKVSEAYEDYDDDYVPGSVSYDSAEEYPDEFYEMYPEGIPSSEAAEEQKKMPEGEIDAALIRDNLPDIIRHAKNADMGFQSIIKKAKIDCADNRVILEFSESFSYDVAVNSGYAKIMTAALSEYFGREVVAVVKRQGKISASEVQTADPLDSVLQLADENQIIFDIKE